MMSKKHYIMIARNFSAMRQVSSQPQKDVLDALAATLALELKRDNPRFDTQRFMEAATK